MSMGEETDHQVDTRTTEKATEESAEYYSTSMATLSESELIKMEFYKTYDVMTGIRIAATLGGFFSMMILLVLYKNYCKPSKSLSDEKLNAAVSAAVEEEDRALAAALEATSFYSSLGKARLSISSGNATPGNVAPRIPSLSSSVRYSSEGDRNLGDDIEMARDDYERLPSQQSSPADAYYTCNKLLGIPDRRLSTATCSSGDTSYLERRGSTFEMGQPAAPCYLKSDKRKLPANEECWDFYYPIDIQVIQPTPTTSPTASEQTLYEEPVRFSKGLQVPNVDNMQRLTVDRSDIGLAPLASISSLGSFTSHSSPYLSSRRLQHEEISTRQEDSLGSDNVFTEDIDTEDEVDGFSTDSEFDDGFDDDYSFCEAQQRPISRCEKKPRFASIDSYDAPDSITDTAAEETHRQQQTSRELGRQFSMQEGGKRKLVKTSSEPRSSRRENKHLPAWVEKGRSRFLPRRQLSMPSGSKDQRLHLPPPCPSSSSSDSVKFTRHETTQGTFKDLPSSEKRARFQKQKTILEGVQEPEENRMRLMLPTIQISGSCDHLADPELLRHEVLDVPILNVSEQTDVVISLATTESTEVPP